MFNLLASDVTKTALAGLSKEERRKKVEGILAKEPGLEFGPGWQSAYLAVEVESMDIANEFVVAVQSWTSEPQTYDPLVPKLACIKLSDVETGKLLLDLVKRLIPLIRRGSEAEVAHELEEDV
eukprot:2600042-Amphidinium_carterae.1